jgi:hypothetical protein
LLLLDDQELNSRVAVGTCHQFLELQVNVGGIGARLKHRQNSRESEQRGKALFE